ncbi:hypothetical protein [Streptomyces sp. NPDC001568]|uniref:hypothetical protein n=1 Tax=Streptomyces sp. NPDC001568 TaxID=3364588 RepID=UPI0036C6FE3F
MAEQKYQVERRGVWQTSFISRADEVKKPDGSAPQDFSTDKPESGSVGWSPQDLLRTEIGYPPRLVEHGGKVYLTLTGGDEQVPVVRYFTPGRPGWTDLGAIPGVKSVRPPALVSHQGNLHAFLKAVSDGQINEAVLSPAGKWTVRAVQRPKGEGSSETAPLSSPVVPGLAVHAGEMHIVWSEGVYGLRYATVKDGVTSTPVPFPGAWTTDEEVKSNGPAESPSSRLSLVSYRNALHLIYTEGDHLKHWINTDGSWAKAPDSPATGTAQSAPSTVEYDGKLYTFYNVITEETIRSEDAVDELIRSKGGLHFQIRQHLFGLISPRLSDIVAAKGEPQVLRQIASHLAEPLRESHSSQAWKILDDALKGKDVPETYTRTVGRIGYQVYDGKSWSGEFVLPVTSSRPPTPVVYKEPGDPTQGRLLLAYTGPGLWTPPPPPPPAPVGPELAHRKARREGMVAKGFDGYSKLNHTLQARVFHNAERNVFHVKATWYVDAWALNFAGTAWGDSGHVSGKIKIAQASSPHRLISDYHFTRDISNGNVTIEVTWEVPPGTYDLTLCNVKKNGGYHFPYSHDDPHRYSSVETGWESVTVVVGK